MNRRTYSQNTLKKVNVQSKKYKNNIILTYDVYKNDLSRVIEFEFTPTSQQQTPLSTPLES